MRSSPAILLLLLCAACERQPSPNVFVDPALAVLIPPETTMVAGIRMQRIQTTPLYQEAVRKAARLKSFQERMGLDPSQDVWEYLITSDGENALVLMRGKFSEMGMEPRLNKPTAQRALYAGVTVIGDEAGAVGFLNPTTAMAGRLETVIRAAERRNRFTGMPAALEQLASKIPSANAAWFASVGPAPGFLPVTRVRSARGGIDPATRRIETVVEAQSTEDARAIAQTLNGTAGGNTVRAVGPVPPGVWTWLLGN